MYMHMMCIQRESPIRCQVYTLPDGNGLLSHGVELHTQDQDMGMFRERLVVFVNRTSKSCQRPEQHRHERTTLRRGDGCFSRPQRNSFRLKQTQEVRYVWVRWRVNIAPTPCWRALRDREWIRRRPTHTTCRGTTVTEQREAPSPNLEER